MKLENCLYDPKAPDALRGIQEWFAEIITTPMDDRSRMHPIAPNGVPMEIEALSYIVKSPTMLPHQRIELYNQQYWWRLLSNMHDNYPLVTRLFGYYSFNQSIATPYLQKYPPNTWTLQELGTRLPQWIQEYYHESDKQLVLDAARIDNAFVKCFTAKELPPLTMDTLPIPGSIQSIIDKKLILQPWVHLFKMDYDLFAFRKEFIKEEDGDYWVDHDFPELQKGKTYYFELHRTRKNDIAWNEISAGQYFLLDLFIQQASIEDVCVFLEKASDEIIQEASQFLHIWFQEWVMRRFLSISTS